MSFNPQEIAKLIVNGQEYTKWDSVWVQERWTESFSFYRFTATEDASINPPVAVEDIQWLPGDKCTVYLGGIPVITGTIITRQASYTATQHLVQLTGKSSAFWAYKSSVFTEDGNFDGKNFEQIANIVLSPYVKPVTIGTLDSSPFAKAQAEIGKPIWDYLQGLAREKGAELGVNRGGVPILIGQHIADIIGTVRDGDNILAMQATITVEDLFMDINVTADNQGGDDNNMTKASQIKGHASSSAPEKATLVIPMEHPPPPPGTDEANKRAQYEKKWTEAARITANVTVQGWFAQNGGLWEAGKNVNVDCPLAVLRGVMKIKTATFEQNNNTGTTTTLELVAPWGLNDQLNVNVAPAYGLRKTTIPSLSPNNPPTVKPAPTGSPVSQPPVDTNFPIIGSPGSQPPI
jgi:prophage tail gpP-like protein